MADFQVDGPELKKLITVMRRQPIAFAFNPAKKDEDHFLGLDRRKAPDVLGRDAKKNGEGGKVAFGMASITSKVMSLQCERVVPGMAKKLKRYLKIQKLSYNIEILDENGNVVEADITDLPDDPEDDFIEEAVTETEPETAAETEQVPQTEPVIDTKAIAARLAACKPQLQAAPSESAKPLIQMFTQAATSLKSGDAPAALATLDALEQALAQLPPPQETSGLDRKEVQAGLIALNGRIKALPEAQSAKLDAPFKQAAGFLKAGELEKTQAAVDRISAAIDKLTAPGTPPVGDSGALAKQAKALRDQIMAITDEATRGKLMTSLSAGVGLIKSGDLEGATAAFAQLEADLKSPSAPKENADEAAFNAVWPALSPKIDAELKFKGPMYATLNAADMAVKDAVAAGDFARALLIATRLEAKLPEAIAARLAAEKAASETMNSVDFAKTCLDWRTARSALHGEMKVLADAILSDLKGGDIEGIETAVNDLFGYLDPIDEALEDELNRLIVATEAAERKTLRDNCIGIIKTFKQELNQGIFADIDNNNGFANVAVQKNALAALDAVANDIEQAAKAA